MRFRISSVIIAGLLAVAFTPSALARNVIIPVSSRPGPVAGLSDFSVCKTSSDYVKLFKTIRRRGDKFEAERSRYVQKRRTHGLPLRESLAEIRRIMNAFERDRVLVERLIKETSYGNPLDVQCRAYPNARVELVDSSSFSGTYCIRPVGSKNACEWTYRIVFELAYKRDGSIKFWVPKSGY